MEEDEEIILENSPLDSYLKEVTFQDFSRYETLAAVNPFISDNSKATEQSPLENHQCTSKAHVKTFNDKLKLIAAFKLFNSNLMNAGDSNLLLDAKDDLDRALKIAKTIIQHPKITKKSSYSRYSIAALVVVLSIFMHFALSLHVTLLLVVSSIVLYCIFYLDIAKRDKEEESFDFSKIDKLTEYSFHFDKLVDKSIQHIKEVEVINVGLQIYHDKLIGGTELLLSNRTQKCLKLRNVLLEMLIDLFTETRQHMRLLLKSHSKGIFSFKEEFVASLPLERFNEIFLQEQPSDDFTLPAVSLKKLKSLTYLYRALLSEFVLGLFVILYENISLKESKTDLYQSFDKLLVVIVNSSRLLEQTLENSIQQTFNKTRHFDKRKVMQGKSIENTNEKFLNNCRINLFSALKRMEEVEEVVGGCGGSITDDTIDFFEKLLLEFFLNVDNARACMEDLFDLHKPKVSGSMDANDTKVERMQQDETSSIAEIRSAVLEPETGDRMYEGDSLRTPVQRGDEPIDIEELQQKLKEKRGSKRLLKELKTVFKVKESPAGLLSFPLTKIENRGDAVETLSSEDDEDALILRQARRRNFQAHHRRRDEDFCGFGEENDAEQEFEASVPIGLPPANLFQGLSLLKNRHVPEEETFGSSDDGNDENGGNDINEDNK